MADQKTNPLTGQEITNEEFLKMPPKDRLRVSQLYVLDEDLRDIAIKMPEMTTQCVSLQATRSANRMVNAMRIV